MSALHDKREFSVGDLVRFSGSRIQTKSDYVMIPRVFTHSVDIYSNTTVERKKFAYDAHRLVDKIGVVVEVLPRELSSKVYRTECLPCSVVYIDGTKLIVANILLNEVNQCLES